MPTYTFNSLAAAARAIKKDCAARQLRVIGSVKKAARVTARVVATDVAPKAFGELADSIHVVDSANGSSVVCDAPHAEAVEVGSRPHMPPLEPIIKWVQLRGLRGVTKNGNFRRSSSWLGGAKTAGSAKASRSVASALYQHIGQGQKGLAAWHKQTKAGVVDPATVAVARAIQAAIAKGGTKPFRFMYAGITTAMVALDTFVKEALPDV
jgi:hypothetical protein